MTAIGLAMLALSGAAAAGTDKTLVSWVRLANTTQQGGSALTIQRDDEFDGIVFGEREAGKWMAGSEFFRRTQDQQGASTAENADAKTLIQMAIVYKGNQISLYRNGELYGSYEASNIDLLTAKDNQAVFGLRHEGAGTGQHLRGSIEDARIYDRALSADEIKKLEPKKESPIKPYAWWTFEKGKETDRMGRFPVNNLDGGAKIEGRTPGARNRRGCADRRPKEDCWGKRRRV
jgi:beta-fructofuranosidase